MTDGRRQPVLSPEQNGFARAMCKISRHMRIETSGKYAWRIDLYDDVGELLDESTRSGAVDGACEFTQQMLPALAKAVEHPDMTEELAEILSTRVVDVEYEISTDVSVRK
ncbi:hypothetical protein GCM10008985_06640 [Halococcus dombrowskii]|uniref:DUF7692 domain-containing protein n=2 Tax=Halococcus dombrowskii TaxID=179637 RepID=A0AAV3SDQ6_HALDO